MLVNVCVYGDILLEDKDDLSFVSTNSFFPLFGCADETQKNWSSKIQSYTLQFQVVGFFPCFFHVYDQKPCSQIYWTGRFKNK